MKALFQKRQRQFWGQCLRYLRYVLNDHFVLVILFLLGFVLVQYRQLLHNLSGQEGFLLLAVLLLLALLFSLGRLATYVLFADKVFLLPQEEAVKAQLLLAQRRSVMLWSLWQSLFLVFLTPLLLAMGWSWSAILGLGLLLIGLRWLVQSHRVKKFYHDHRLNWDKVISSEQERQQTLLTFFALFTSVKGISTRTKRRAYLDGLLAKLPKNSKTLWLNLYLRAFLRSGEYLALSLRLLGLSFLVLMTVKVSLVAVGLTLVLNYLLLFQLLALYHHYDYQYMTQLYLLDRGLKKSNLLLFLRGLGVFVALLQSLFIWSLQGLAVFWLVMGMVLVLYLPYKLKQMID